MDVRVGDEGVVAEEAFVAVFDAVAVGVGEEGIGLQGDFKAVLEAVVVAVGVVWVGAGVVFVDEDACAGFDRVREAVQVTVILYDV